MTKKIFSSIMLTAACVLLASMITTVGFLRDYFGGIEESGLREELGIAAVGVEDDGMDYLAALPDGRRRGGRCVLRVLRTVSAPRQAPPASAASRRAGAHPQLPC